MGQNGLFLQLRAFLILLFHAVDEKFINSQSKKGMENCIRAKLRIVTWETVSRRDLRTSEEVRGRSVM